MFDAKKVRAFQLGLLILAAIITSGALWAKDGDSAKQILPRSSFCQEEVEKAQKANWPPSKLAPKLIDLGDAYRREGATSEAIQEYERALLMLKNNKELTNPRAMSCQLALADLYEDRGRYDKSALVYSQALENAGSSEAYRAEILPQLADVMVKQEKLQQAEQVFKKALACCEGYYRPSDPHIANVLQHYAELLRKLNRPAEADKLSLRAKALLTRQQSALSPANTTPANELAKSETKGGKHSASKSRHRRRSRRHRSGS